jgi:hypothetical protein
VGTEENRKKLRFFSFKHSLKNPQIFSQNSDIYKEESKFYDKKLG